jgi:hypothetical protein
MMALCLAMTVTLVLGLLPVAAKGAVIALQWWLGLHGFAAAPGKALGERAARADTRATKRNRAGCVLALRRARRMPRFSAHRAGRAVTADTQAQSFLRSNTSHEAAPIAQRGDGTRTSDL